MTVSFHNLRKTEDGKWEVRDLNGEDWYPLVKFGHSNPGSMIEDLISQVQSLHRVVKNAKSEMDDGSILRAYKLLEKALTEYTAPQR